ncbi:MAG: DUF1549 and DUF1553 domain-containing protein [Chthonomonadales bacterium]
MWLAFCLLALTAPAPPSTLTPAWIDHRIRLEWRKMRIEPAPPVDDARFLRRVYLDIAGVIPPPEAVTAFLKDRRPDKRARIVDELLASPAYADHWTDYWDDVLLGPRPRGQVLDRAEWRRWLHQQFATNTPWNRFVEALLTASGQNSQGGSYRRLLGFERDAAASSAPDGSAASSKVNGAVNWHLQYAQNPAELAGKVSKIFLGVQIQCAQCHDHKTEHWKQTDFQRFTACFMQMRAIPIDRGKVMGVRRVMLTDVPQSSRFLGRNLQSNLTDYLRATPAALDGTEFSNAPNRRAALAQWITAPDNPWFAQAVVNRMWAYFLGRGFVDPIDDFRSSNPPVLPDLLNRLAADFVASGYDLKHLIRLITSTQVYGLASAKPARQDPENKLWSRYRLKPLEPEQLLASIVQATGLQPLLERRARGNLQAMEFALRRQFAFLFDTDMEAEQKEFEGTIPQALMLINGRLVNEGSRVIPGTALSAVLQLPAPKQRIEALYLRTLGRPPTSVETQQWLEFVSAPLPHAGHRSAAPRLIGDRGNRRSENLPAGGSDAEAHRWEDLFWALLNCSEFQFNH